jgi:hypothetical protein
MGNWLVVPKGTSLARRSRVALCGPPAESRAPPVPLLWPPLGERGPVWWHDGAPHLNRNMVKNRAYADGYDEVRRAAHTED